MMYYMELVNKLYYEILDIEVVDIHEHLNPGKLAAESINDILFYHYITTELMCAGLDRKKFVNLPPKEKLIEALPYFKFIRNTTTFWSLLQILRDLYKLNINTIDENSLEKIIEAVENMRKDFSWAYTVLKKFCKIKKSILTLNPLEVPPTYDRNIFVGSLRVDVLVQNISKDVLINIENRYNIDIEDVETFDKALESIFKEFDQHIVAITLPIQPDEVFKVVHKNEVSLYIKQLKTKGIVNSEARIILASYTLHKLLELCSRYRKVFQLMLGVKRPIPNASPPDYAITMYDPRQTIIITKLLAAHPDVKFDLIVADATFSHQITVIAKNYPNAYLSGYWWYSMYPEIIRNYLRLRLQMLPYNKIGGFFSDAYVVEWVYGKVLLTKKQIAYVLTEMIYEGYIDKNLAIEIAHAILHENASKLYNL